VVELINANFLNTVLSKQEQKLLKKAYVKATIPYNVNCRSLIKNDMLSFCNFTTDSIGQQIPVEDFLKITEKGIAYIKTLKREKFRFYFPSIISIVSLLTSIISLAFNHFL